MVQPGRNAMRSGAFHTWTVAVSLAVLAALPADGSVVLYPNLRLGCGDTEYPNAVTVADFNGDGTPDVAGVVGLWGATNTICVALGNGDGTFGPTVWYPADLIMGGAIAAGDFDGDEQTDIVVAVVAGGANLTSFSLLLGNGDGTFSPPSTFETGPEPYSVAVADFDNDGALDLLMGCYSGACVHRGDGNGGFFPCVETGIPVFYAAEVGDFNGDGIVDIVSTVENFRGLGGAVEVHLGNGDLTFVEASSNPVGNYWHKVAVDDFDRDGNEDLVVTNHESNDISILLGHGDGTFEPEQRHPITLTTCTCRPSAVAVGDLDGNGTKDLVVSLWYSWSVAVFLGTGDGGFAPAVYYRGGGRYSFGIAIADFDADGAEDVIQAWGPFTILRGNGDGTLIAPLPTEVGETPQALAISDLDGDGLWDFAVANGSNGISVTLGNGDGTFGVLESYALGLHVPDIAVGDFDGDDVNDLAVPDDAANAVHALFGIGDGTFGPEVSFAVGSRPGWVISEDLDGDGDDDVVVANQASDDISVLLSDGRGSFAPEVRYAVGMNPRSLVVGDLDGDDVPDLVTANEESQNISVLLGGGDGTFLAASPVSTVGHIPWYVTLGDVNGDTTPDLVASGKLPTGFWTLSVHLGQGDGTFLPETQVPGAGAIAVADVDADGHQDLLAGVSVILGNGDGTFQSGTAYGGDLASGGVVDLDGNGRPDRISKFGTVSLNHCLDTRVLYGDDKISVEWQEVCGAQTYNMYKGDLPALVDADTDGLPDAGYGECVTDLDNDPTDLTFVDTELPPPGTGSFYLMSYVEAEGERGLGETSAGLPREVLLPCP